MSDWEKNEFIRSLIVIGKSLGTSTLRAQLNGRDWVAPLTVRVISDASCRQVGKGKAQVTPELRAEIQRLRLSEAVIRVAEDQMNSAISQSSGFGVYEMDAKLDWCGGFAYWCENQACAIKGTPMLKTAIRVRQHPIHGMAKPFSVFQLILSSSRF